MMPHTIPALYKSQILDEAVMPIAHSSEPVRFQHFMRASRRRRALCSGGAVWQWRLPAAAREGAGCDEAAGLCRCGQMPCGLFIGCSRTRQIVRHRDHCIVFGKTFGSYPTLFDCGQQRRIRFHPSRRISPAFTARLRSRGLFL
jgi:hypothetical protein